MGILVENGYENLGMMDHSIEMFWTCVSEHQMILVMKMLRHEPYPFIKLMVVWMRYHSNFTVQPQYPKIWVGLDWKLMYLSMGSLTAKV